ncbi:MAG: membrane protein insertion efficiency factor YidD [Formosimonas sp.]
MKRFLILLVRGYQLMISPFTANHCRFHPTCSRYAIIAIERHGPLRGTWLAMKRIGRCRPGCEPGFDPVPTLEEYQKNRQHKAR